MARRHSLFALAVSTVLVCGCGGLQRPEIRAVRQRVQGLDLQGVNLVFDVDIHNPYPMALRVPRFDYAIDIQGTEFVKSQAPVEIDLPAGQTGTAQLPARFEYVQLWRTYRALADAAEIKYRLRGAIPITVLGQTYELPVAHEGKFPVLRLPKIELGKVNFSEVSLSKATATVTGRIHNPNAFALGVKDLGYALMLGDAPVGVLSASTLESIPAGQTGELRLNGDITARSALARILQGGDFGDARVAPIGKIETPVGPVSVER